MTGTSGLSPSGPAPVTDHDGVCVDNGAEARQARESSRGGGLLRRAFESWLVKLTARAPDFNSWASGSQRHADGFTA